MLSVGYEVDRYVVEEKLGEGGMAVVYRVRHKTLGTRHALKVLSINSTDVRERMINEGRLQARLQHPNIVTVSDVLVVDGSPGLLMEYIQGPALDHWLYNYSPTLDEVLSVFRGVVAGVGHAHAKGLIHRDLKPANVMLAVTETGIVPKVADFGLAKGNAPGMSKTRTGATMGTPTYMAPEQIRDASSVDRRADIYSLGVLLYELTCGRPPYVDDDIIELFGKVARGDYEAPKALNPSLPREVWQTIDALLEVRVANRVSDCRTIIDLLEGAVLPSDLESHEEDTILPPPKRMGEVDNTRLESDAPGAAVAARFVKELVSVVPDGDTPVPVRTNSGLGIQVDAETERLDAPSAPPVVERRRSTAAAFVGLGALVGVLVLLVLGMGAALTISLWMQGQSGTVVEPEPGPLTEPVPAPVEPDPTPEPRPEPRPDPQPEPVVSPPPVPGPPPRPAPVVPEPVVPDPTPVPAPPPEPEPANTGSFSYYFSPEAPGHSVVLNGKDGKALKKGEPVEPGRYPIQVLGPDGGGAGKVTIRAGENANLKCVLAMMKCLPQ